MDTFFLILGGTLVQEEPETAGPTSTLRGVWDSSRGYSRRVRVTEGSGKA